MPTFIKETPFLSDIQNITFADQAEATKFFEEQAMFGKPYKFIYTLNTDPSKVYYIDEIIGVAVLLGSGGGGAVLFPNGTETVTESREYLHTDIGKALILAEDDVFLTMPEGVFWTEEEKGQVIVVIGNAQNIGYDQTFEFPVLIQGRDETNEIVGEYVLLVTGETDEQSDVATISSAVIKHGDDYKTAIKALFDNSGLAIAADLDTITPDAQIGTTVGSLTLQILALLLYDLTPLFINGVRTVSVSRDWEEDDANSLVVVSQGQQLTMPAISPFSDGQIVLIATQSIGGTVGKFQLSNGGALAHNMTTGVASSLEIVKMYWNNGESRFVPLGTTYIAWGGELKSQAKFLYDRSIQIPYSITAGTATLVAGTVTVANSTVKSTSKIQLTVNTPLGTLGLLSAPVGSIIDNTSFVINSVSALDTSTINYTIFTPLV